MVGRSAAQPMRSASETSIASGPGRRPSAKALVLADATDQSAADRVQELALDERPARDLQAQRHDEGGHDVDVCNREADVVEGLDVI